MRGDGRTGKGQVKEDRNDGPPGGPGQTEPERVLDAPNRGCGRSMYLFVRGVVPGFLPPSSRGPYPNVQPVSGLIQAWTTFLAETDGPMRSGEGCLSLGAPRRLYPKRLSRYVGPRGTGSSVGQPPTRPIYRVRTSIYEFLTDHNSRSSDPRTDPGLHSQSRYRLILHPNPGT